MNQANIPRARGRAPALACAAVLALCCIAVLLRLHGIAFGLPHSIEPDGYVLVRQVLLMQSQVATPEFEDNWAFYPHLIARILSAFVREPRALPEGASVADHLANGTSLHLQIRTGVALLSVLAVPGTYWLARKFLSRGAALFAAALMTTSLLQVWFAQESRPHSPAAAFALLAVVAALCMRAKPSVGWYAVAGIATGLAVGSLQSGAPALFALVCAHVLRERGGESAPKRSRLWPLALALLLFLGVCAALYPFLLKPTSETNSPKLYSAGNTFEFFGHSIFYDKLNGRGFVMLFTTLVNFELVACVLAALGTLLWFARRPRTGERFWRRHPELCVVLAYVVAYALALGIYERTYERFVIQLLPFVYCAAAFGACSVWSFLARRAHSPAGANAIACIGALAFLALPAWGTWRLTSLRAGTDSAERAAAWIEKHADPVRDSIVLVPFLDLPLMRDLAGIDYDRQLGWSSPWFQQQRVMGGVQVVGTRWNLHSFALTDPELRARFLPDPIGWFRQNGARTVAVPVPFSARVSAVHHHIHVALRQQAELLARFPEDASGLEEEATLSFEDLPAPRHVNWTLALLHRFSCVGPVIEIYRIR